MSEILERGVFLNCLLDQTEVPWEVEAEMIRCHDAALRLALAAATRERDEANSMFRDYALATQTIGTESALAGIDDPDGTLVGIYRNTLKKLTTAELERDEARRTVISRDEWRRHAEEQLADVLRLRFLGIEFASQYGDRALACKYDNSCDDSGREPECIPCAFRRALGLMGVN